MTDRSPRFTRSSYVNEALRHTHTHTLSLSQHLFISVHTSSTGCEAMAGASTPPQYCCDASSSSSPRCLPVSHGRCSHHFLPFPSSSSSRSYRLRQISIIRASGSRRDRDPAGKKSMCLDSSLDRI